MAQNRTYGASSIRNEEITTSPPLEIPGLFSEYGGITSEINSPFELGNQTEGPVEAMSSEGLDTSVTELTFNSPEKSQPRSLDICDYLQLLDQPKFASAERRRQEMETELPENEEEGRLQQDPVIWPDELFSSVNDDYEEMCSYEMDNLLSGDEASHNEIAEENSNEDNPLYSGAPLTVSESLLLIVTFAMRHALSGSALSDLLILVSLHCINPNMCCKSLHQFQHFFSIN